MSALLGHLLATYGLWFVLTQSDTPGYGPWRDALAARHPRFQEFIHCPMCSGYWCSLLIALATTAATTPFSFAAAVHVVILTLAGAAGCFLIETMVRRLEAR